jgi:aspartate/methionine/tyrosine aminotransferase
VPKLNPLLVATAAPPIPAAHRWRARYDGRFGPVIDLAQAVPGSPPPRAFLDRLAAAAAMGETAAYGPILGDAGLRQALALEINTVYGAHVEAADIAITAGCNQAFFVAMMALAGPGDAVILPAPWYFNHKMTLDMLGVSAVPLPCRAERGFVPAVEDARALIGPATRAIVLVTPNNPTGATYPAPILQAFQDLARQAGIALVVDETYRDFLPQGQGRPHALFDGDAWRETTIQLYSFSKAYAIPGHRLGAMTADAAVLEHVAKILDCMIICPPRIPQAAVAWAIETTREWRGSVRDAINRRAALFGEAIAGSPGWSISAIGAYFAYVRHPLGGSAEAAAERLAGHAGLVTLPGSFFGPGQEDHLRFAFANVDEAQIGAVADRLRAASRR